MKYNKNIYVPKLKYNPDIIKIDDNNFISISEYTLKLNTFFDVIFNNNGKEIFVGRYMKEFENIGALYNHGKILVYTYKYISEKYKDYIVKVHTLYDILDDFHYITTEENALEIFDPEISKDYLEDKDRMTFRIDINKKNKNK